MNTAQTEAVANADAHTNNAALPTYTQLVAALRHLEWACSGVEYMEDEYAAELKQARDLLVMIEE